MSIPKKIIDRITDRQWYHQRFDGSPMFLYVIADAESRREKRKLAGTEADIRACFFSDGKADWYLDSADIERGANILVEKAKTDALISKKLLKQWKKDETRFDEYFSKAFPKIRLSKLTDQDLVALWNEEYELGAQRLSSSSVIDHFALGTDELIQKMLQNEVGKLGRVSDFTEIFSTLTAPVHQSFINQAEIDILKIACGDSPETIPQYQKRYYWILNNYYKAAMLTVADFRKDISSWRASGKDLRAEYRKIQETPARSKRKKQALLKKLKLSKHVRTLLTISEDFTWWQDERKRATYLNIDMGSRILAEIAKRIDFDVDELKYAIPPEVEGLLTDKKPTRQELQMRRAHSTFIVNRHGSWVVYGDESKTLQQKMLGEATLDDIQDIRGLTACTGKAIGTVRVLRSSTEIGKVNPGDVIVAVMTRPDYVPAMKKAAAIVTDEGGITSHAAIVSRELGIPCIIGTKIATKVFKDGERVEVNANHGWARKVGI